MTPRTPRTEAGRRMLNDLPYGDSGHAAYAASICRIEDEALQRVDDMNAALAARAVPEAPDAALREAASAALDWLREECVPDGAEFAGQGHLWNMTPDDLTRAENVRDALGRALRAARLPSPGSHNT